MTTKLDRLCPYCKRKLKFAYVDKLEDGITLIFVYKCKKHGELRFPD